MWFEIRSSPDTLVLADALAPRREALLDVSNAPDDGSVGRVLESVNDLGVGIPYVFEAFTQAVLMWYPDGDATTGWHQDYLQVGGGLTAVLSIGATRTFSIRPYNGDIGVANPPHRAEQTMHFDVQHGDVVWMGGDFQLAFQHRLDFDPGLTDARWCVAFRLPR